MNKSAIVRCLGTHPWTENVLVYEQVTSTNTVLKAMAQQGAPHGTVLIADRQSAGRGRLGRSFLSPGGKGVYLSVLIRPNAAPTQLMHLTCAAAVAMCDAVQAAAGIRPQIKWTNDLVVGRQKLGGILTELALEPDTHAAAYAVIGVGINCSQDHDEFDPSIRSMATSLFLSTGKTVDRNLLCAEIIRSFYRMNEQLIEGKEDTLLRYTRDCITVGQDIQLILRDTVRHGKALGIDSDGGLTVEFENGQTETVSCGEVSVRGMYGYT